MLSLILLSAASAATTLPNVTAGRSNAVSQFNLATVEQSGSAYENLHQRWMTPKLDADETAEDGTSVRLKLMKVQVKVPL